MFKGNADIFPNNVVVLAADRLDSLDADVPVMKRRLYNTDPRQSIGIMASTWTPDENSYEMMGQSSRRPSINIYHITVQCLVKSGNDETGLATHAEMSQAVRNMLMGDPVLAATLRTLSSNAYGVRESVKTWTVESQRYASEEASGVFTFLSTLQVRLETEIRSGI